MIQQKYSQIKLPQKSPALYFIEFRLGARSWNTWRGTCHVMYSVRTRDAQQQWARTSFRARIFTVLCLLTCNMVQSLLGLASSPIFSVSSCSSSCCLSVVKLLRLCWVSYLYTLCMMLCNAMVTCVEFDVLAQWFLFSSNLFQCLQ